MLKAKTMAVFYTVDRIGALKAGGTIELCSPDYSFPHHHAQNKETSLEIEQTIKDLFPLGLSPHGLRYLFDRYQFLQGAISVSPMIELMVELVRRLEFSDYPSRLESFFGTESIETARRFKAEFSQPHHRVFKVSCARHFKADMRLLVIGASAASSINLFKKYWRGESSLEPLWEVLMVPPVTIIEQVDC